MSPPSEMAEIKNLTYDLKKAQQMYTTISDNLTTRLKELEEEKDKSKKLQERVAQLEKEFASKTEEAQKAQVELLASQEENTRLRKEKEEKEILLKEREE